MLSIYEILCFWSWKTFLGTFMVFSHYYLPYQSERIIDILNEPIYISRAKFPQNHRCICNNYANIPALLEANFRYVSFWSAAMDARHTIQSYGGILNPLYAHGQHKNKEIHDNEKQKLRKLLIIAFLFLNLTLRLIDWFLLSEMQ